MIVVYPMLTSSNVSSNVLPGIIKAVEKYILLYNANDVLKMAGITDAGHIISTGAGILATAAATAAVGIAADRIKNKYFKEGKLMLPAPEKTEPNKQYFKPDLSQVGKPVAKASLDIPSKSDAVSLEPTWMTVTTSHKGAQVLGVKVVPFRIKSTDPIMHLLTQDSQVKTLDFLGRKYTRMFTRVLYRTLRKTKVPLASNLPITGDPKKDILMGQTQYGKNMFLCFSELDIENNDIFSSPKLINKIQSMGWASMVITDDVNRRATFCMKEFGGMCSVIPYNYMFASLGKDLNKAYEDLEDLKKSAGPFFNKKTNRKKVFSEQMVTLNKYLNRIQD